MIELIGFWTNVSIIVASASAVPLYFVVVAIAMMINHVTQDTKYGKAFESLFWHDYDLGNEYPNRYTKFFSTFSMRQFDAIWLAAGAMALSITFWVSAAVILYAPIKGDNRWQPDNLVELVSDTAQAFAAVTGPITAIAIAYFLLVPVLRKGFHFYQRVNAVLTPKVVEDEDERKAS